MTLNDFGWNDFFDRQWQQPVYNTLRPARVIADYGTKVRIALPEEADAVVAGSLLHTRTETPPKVGDWVGVEQIGALSRVTKVLRRKSEIHRRSPGNKDEKQVLAVNVDLAFLVIAADEDFSINRLHRYMLQLRQQTINHVVVLNKIDKSPKYKQLAKQLQSSTNADVITLSALQSADCTKLLAYISKDTTAVLLGSSGVGKSTLTNALLGNARQATQATRSDDNKGRHTTVVRELFVLPKGGLMIDTPGLRELQLWGSASDLDAAYSDIADLALLCKFNDCRHETEPGCAVQKAVHRGDLREQIFSNYQKMRLELEQLTQRTDAAARNAKKQSDRPQSHSQREKYKKKLQ